MARKPDFIHMNNKGAADLLEYLRAYLDSEFAVANSLANWKKLEPNDINFCQGFSQKVVSTSCFVFNPLPTRVDFCCLLFDLILYVPSTIFQLYRDGSSWV